MTLDELPVNEVAAGEDYEPQPPQLSNDDLQFEAKVFVLRALMEKASSVLPTKDLMPVLKNFQVEVGPGQLRILATDLELSVIATTEMVTTQQGGVAVFPGKKMLDIIREAEDGDVIVQVQEGVARLQAGRAVWDIRLMDGSDYPPLPVEDELEFHEIDRVHFLGAISMVRYAAATESIRPSLMMIDVTEGKLRAADGVRFQQVDLGDKMPLNIQIPIGAVDDLVKLLRTTDVDTIGIGESEHQLVFRVGTDIFIANKMIAQFPDIESILLKPALGNDKELTVDRSELLDAIKRVRITADPETSAIVLKLSAGLLRLEARDKFGSGSYEDLDCGWSSGERELVVNHKYLTDMLTMADVKTCSFWLGADVKTKKSAVLLKDTETGMLGIIQQMKADWVIDEQPAVPVP